MEHKNKKMKQSTMQHIRNAIMIYLRSIGVENRFYGVTLIDYVRQKIDKPNIYDDTVLRQMRLLKNKGQISFFCTGDPRKSTYVLTGIK